MKLFAPTANWDMKSDSSWWPLMGSVRTNAGINVSKENALTLSAVLCAQRIISETLASLPLNVIEQEDFRTTKKAYDHPLYPILHDAPNSEQDIMSWLDMQSGFQTGWGNAFAEVQRTVGGQIAALWAIHPSRIPIHNICRNPTTGPDVFHIVAGHPGELVYYVRNDDQTVTPIPASDILLVPGIMSTNGITGQSIIEKGASVIGNAMAAEAHASAFFRNGAVANVAIKSLKTVGKDTADRLREQWQKTFGGVHNHYKTLLLEDGMEPVPFSISPEASQLLATRQYGVSDVARLYRMPPHKLADLSRSSFTNIESENQSFVIDTMLPWITRWEKAMHRQLLTAEEKKRYRFKFNVNGLLRGDSQARANFYQTLFNLGAMSPNDIRAREDENPIVGGDQYFVQGNNAVPLDKIGELAQSQIDKAKAPAPAPAAKPDPNIENHERLKELRRMNEELILKVEMRDASEAERARVADELKRQQEAELPELVAKAVSPVAETVKTLAAQQAETATEVKAFADIAQASLVAGEQRQGQMDAFRDNLPTMLTEAIDALAKQAAAARDTTESDEIAARKADLDRKQAENEAKQAVEREITHNVLVLSVKREIDKLAEWESKWLDKASEKPDEWVDARAKYYSRFRKQFVATMEEYVAHADLCGVVLDLQWGADRYADQSITDLKTLDKWATDNFHDRLRECADMFRKSQWSERSQTLASEMIERGRRLHSERTATPSQGA